MLKEATKRQEKTDAEIVFDEEDPDEEEDVDEDEEVDVDDFDLELFHFFDCIGCKAIFQEKTAWCCLYRNIVSCAFQSE